jgi:hypothetical protein
MLAAGAALFGYSLWFANNTSPVFERFNMRRMELPTDAPGSRILRQRAGDFERAALTVDTLEAQGGGRHGAAIYRDFEGKAIQFEARLVGEGKAEAEIDTESRANAPTDITGIPSLEALFADFGARAGVSGVNPSDLSGVAIRLFPEARYPYGFGVYSSPTYTYFEFIWLNNGWVLRASTREAGSESLLRFVNGYMY